MQDNMQDRGYLMDGYKPPFTITNKILRLVSSISEKTEKATLIINLETRPHLRRNNRIKSIHSSLKIEANSLTLNQVRDVINGKVVLGEKKEMQEVKNAYEAYDRIEQINPYDINDLKKFHGIMTRYLVEESGEFRKGEEGVFSGNECIFMAPPAKFVPQLMSQLFGWMNEMKDEIHPLVMGCIFHYEFVFIHPFSDGNGRMARLWHSAILYKWKPIFAYVPIESQIEKFQEDYYDVIAKCHGQGVSTSFIEFMLARIDAILDEVVSQIDDNMGQVSEFEKRLLTVMEFNVSYTSRELMEKLKLKSREGFRRNYLQPAIKDNLIVMTIADKPNSKNQRYVRRREVFAKSF